MKTAGVLIVDDDEDDFFLTRRVLARFVAGPIVHVGSGRDAIHYLNGQAPFSDRIQYPNPDLVLLDLKMDDISGHEVLQWVRAHLPGTAPRIFVLTGSNESRDRQRVHDLGVAAGYIVKPLAPEHLQTLFGTGVAG